ncbi:MAG TPA: ABC transporter permease [Solirubrobacteraceae bacterium]|nr:ABC transporter permease [Solirubrobacteraceae bacterium]
MTASIRILSAFQRRALNEILRVPGGAIPGVLAPAIFLIGLSGVFGAAGDLKGYQGDFTAYILPFGMLQGATFTGAATGVNLARDIEQGWFDRLLLAPQRRSLLLLGLVSSASLRATLPATFLLLVGFALGVGWPGIGALAIAYVLIMGFAGVIACYASLVALRFRTQQAAPLMQIGGFIAILFTTAYAPLALQSSWLADIARINPVNKILEGVRQGFVPGTVTWDTTWQALVALAVLGLVLGGLAVRSMRRTGR